MPKDRETNSIWPNLEPSLMVNLIQEHKYICYKWGGERLSQIGAYGILKILRKRMGGHYQFLCWGDVNQSGSSPP